MTGGALLTVLGIVHNVVGLPALQRAVSRGELAQRLAAPHTVNWFFSGAAISLLGVVVMLAAWELGGPGRLARNPGAEPESGARKGGERALSVRDSRRRKRI